jgi:hypothetical protein
VTTENPDSTDQDQDHDAANAGNINDDVRPPSETDEIPAENHELIIENPDTDNAGENQLPMIDDPEIEDNTDMYRTVDPGDDGANGPPVTTNIE